MRWITSNVTTYVQAKEYIDTMVIPLIPIQIADEDSELEQNAYQHEVMRLFLQELEKELSGRMMLSPSYYYLKTSDKERETDRLQGWSKEYQKQPFVHIFYVTFDAQWKKHEKTLDGTLLWLPAIQSGDIQSKEVLTFVRENVNQVVELIRSYW